MLEARKPSTELRDLLHQVIVEVRSEKVGRQVLRRIYHEIGYIFATYQERSWITQVGIDLEDRVVLPRVIQTEQVRAEISLDRVLRNRDVSTDHSHQNRQITE